MKQYDDLDFVKYLAGEASPQEAMELENWIAQSDANRQAFDEAARTWSGVSGRKVYPSVSLEETWQQITDNAMHRKNRARRRTIGYISLLAAACLLAIVTVFYMKKDHIKKDTIGAVQYVTRETGEKIVRDSLPDGSVVILGQAATIRYPLHFEGNDRPVILSKEGWFDVVADPAKPFIVSIGALQIKVIGTTFNVLETNSQVEVSVTSGVVRIGDGHDSLTVRTGQKGIYHAVSRQFELQSGFDPNTIGYATRIFSFTDNSLQEITVLLAKAYNIRFVLNDPRLGQCRMSSSFENKPLDYVLEVIAATLGLEYQLKNDTVYLNGSGCN
ncbi:MAG: FecR domain-containing protein [Chitinophagaceae bacterium]